MNVAQVSASAALTSLDALMNGGTLVFYSGTMPATPETALSGNTALVTFAFAATAFGAPSFGSGKETATASFVASSVMPSAGGTAGFARAYESNGTTVANDYTVGTSGTDIVLGSTTITMGVAVQLTFTQSLPAV